MMTARACASCRVRAGDGSECGRRLLAVAAGRTRRPGSGNGGHDFWQRIRTDVNRRALIDYLKTL